MNIVAKINVLLVLTIMCISCGETSSDKESYSADTMVNKDTLEFYFEVNKEVYLKSDYGEAPQVAIWLEYPDSTFYKTVFVTRRSGRNDWEGKVECPVALPYWNARKKNEEEPGIWKKLVDAVSGATEVNGQNHKTVEVEKGSDWFYFIEVNASGDYNEHFSYWSDNGIPDSEGNGQPSIIYSGKVTAGSKIENIPILIGISNQYYATDTLSTDLHKISTAQELISKVIIKG